mmetsp:Transcript_8329/g.21485  ORF Transcript_8329/g.21485 Transcript_8329/m.21485 type:complete len:213 (+) Transcript_8329:329-967(+)
MWCLEGHTGGEGGEGQGGEGMPSGRGGVVLPGPLLVLGVGGGEGPDAGSGGREGFEVGGGGDESEDVQRLLAVVGRRRRPSVFLWTRGEVDGVVVQQVVVLGHGAAARTAGEDVVAAGTALELVVVARSGPRGADDKPLARLRVVAGTLGDDVEVQGSLLGFHLEGSIEPERGATLAGPRHDLLQRTLEPQARFAPEHFEEGLGFEVPRRQV